MRRMIIPVNDLIQAEADKLLAGLSHQPTADDRVLAMSLAVAMVTGDLRPYRKNYFEIYGQPVGAA